MRRLLPIIICLILLAACAGEGRERGALDAAQAVINHRPDSALAILDSLEPSSHAFSRPSLRRWQLLRLMAQNKCDTVFRSDSLQLILADYYDHHGTPNERMWAHYLLGRAYYDMGEALPALRAYENAAAAADTAAADCDYWNLCRVYCQEALLLHYQSLPEEVFNTLDDASKAAKKAGDTITRIICYEKRAMAYERLGKLDSMAVAGMTASAMYHDIGNDELAAQALYWVIPYNIENGDFHLAKKNMDVYESQSGFFDNDHRAKAGREHYYSEKGKYYLGVGLKDSAEICFRRCLVMHRKPGSKISREDYYRIHAGLHGLAKLYSQYSQPDSASKYALLSEAYNDSTYLYTYMAEAIQLKKLFSQARLMDKEEKLKIQVSNMNRKIWMIFSLALFLASLCAALLFHRKKMLKENLAREKRQALYDDILDILKDMKEKQSIGMAKYMADSKEDLSHITDMLDENKNLIDKAVGLIKEQGERMDWLKEKDSDLGHERKEKKSYPIVQQILSVGYQLQMELTESEWNEIDEYMGKKHPLCQRRLRSMEKINRRDYHICLLTILGVPSSFAAILIGCNQATLSMSKKRLLEKLTGKAGSGKELQSYLKSLDIV